MLRGTISLSASSSSCAVTRLANQLAEDGPGQEGGKGDVFFFRLKERRGFFDDGGRFSLSPSMAHGCTKQRFPTAHAHKHVVIITKQLKHGFFVNYRIYPYSLAVSSLKIEHKAEFLF